MMDKHIGNNWRKNIKPYYGRKLLMNLILQSMLNFHICGSILQLIFIKHVLTYEHKELSLQVKLLYKHKQL